MSLLYLEPQFVPVRLSTAAHLHSERKRLEGKTRSNKASACLMRDRCSALRECVSERGSDPSRTAEKKNPHLQVVQKAEFAAVGIGIALLRSHAQRAAFALNRSGDYAVAGEKSRFSPNAAFSRQQRSRVPRLPRTGHFSRLLFSDE